MIRITTLQEHDSTVVIIDGHVTDADVSEIQRIRTALPGTVILSLGGMSTCVAEGVRVLRDWLDSGARLRDATLFLRMILEAAPDKSRHMLNDKLSRNQA